VDRAVCAATADVSIDRSRTLCHERILAIASDTDDAPNEAGPVHQDGTPHRLGRGSTALPILGFMEEAGETVPEPDSLAGVVPVRPSTKKFDFVNLSPTDFEDFVFDLLTTIGFVNVDWRKGTPKSASPSDRGRDIEAQYLVTDVDGHQRFERWFVDAKHYEKGVPPESLQGLFTWAQSQRPDVALVAASGFLSNPAKDWIEQYCKTSAPPFRIRHWERPQISEFLAQHPELTYRHEIYEQDAMRSLAEIQAAETEMYNRRWYDRSKTRDHFVEIGQVEPLPDELREQVLSARSLIEAELGTETLQVGSDWEAGLWAGKHSALRWVLGDDWDNLDT